MNYRCGWCRQLSWTRRPRLYCSKSCRQAAHRARLAPSPNTTTPATRDPRPRTLAYADPPYPGLARRYYHCPEVDHLQLLRTLMLYDGWALSTSAPAERAITSLARELGATFELAYWHRGARPGAPTYEPVLFHRPQPSPNTTTPAHTTPTELYGRTPRRRTTLPTAVIGAKPTDFCLWLFHLLDAGPLDDLTDLFPGSGIVGRSWHWYCGRDPAKSAHQIPLPLQ